MQTRDTAAPAKNVNMAELFFLKGLTFLEKNDFDKAIKSFEFASKQNPKEFNPKISEALFAKGFECLQCENLDSAIKYFHHATLQKDYQNLKAIAYLESVTGRHQFYNTQFAEALKHYDCAINTLKKMDDAKENDTHTSYFAKETQKKLLAKLYCYKGQAAYGLSAHAQNLTKPSYPFNEKNWDVYFNEAKQYQPNINNWQAKYIFIVNYVYSHLLSIMRNPRSATANDELIGPHHFLHANCMWKTMMAKGKFEHELRHLQAALKYFPNNPSTWFDLSIIKLRESETTTNIPKKRELLLSSVQGFSKVDTFGFKAITAYSRGLAYMKLKDIASAYSDFLRAITKDLHDDNNELEGHSHNLPQARLAILEDLAKCQYELVEDAFSALKSAQIADQKDAEKKAAQQRESLKEIYQQHELDHSTLFGISNNILLEPTRADLYLEKAKIYYKLKRFDFASYEGAIALWLCEKEIDKRPEAQNEIFCCYLYYILFLLEKMEFHFCAHNFSNGQDDYVYLISLIQKMIRLEGVGLYLPEVAEDLNGPLAESFNKLVSGFHLLQANESKLDKIVPGDIDAIKNQFKQFFIKLAESPPSLIAVFMHQRKYEFEDLFKTYCRQFLITEGDKVVHQNKQLAIQFYRRLNIISPIVAVNRVAQRMQILNPPVDVFKTFKDNRSILEKNDLALFDQHLEQFMLGFTQLTEQIKESKKAAGTQTLVIKAIKGYNDRGGRTHFFKSKNAFNFVKVARKIVSLITVKHEDQAASELLNLLTAIKDELVSLTAENIEYIKAIFLRYFLMSLDVKAEEWFSKDKIKAIFYYEAVCKTMDKPFFADVKAKWDANQSCKKIKKSLERNIDNCKKEIAMQAQKTKASNESQPASQDVKDASPQDVKDASPHDAKKPNHPHTPIQSLTLPAVLQHGLNAPAQPNAELAHKNAKKKQPRAKQKAESTNNKMTHAPSLPSTQAPASPMTRASSSPTTHAPASPITQAPASPNTQAPASPTTHAPASPATKDAKDCPPCLIPNVKVQLPDQAIDALKKLRAAGAHHAFVIGGTICEAIKPFNKKTDIDIVFGAENPLTLLKTAFKNAEIVQEGDFFKVTIDKTFSIDIWHSEALSDKQLSQTAALKKDALTRDFTINALYADHNKQVFDPTTRGYIDLTRSTPRLKCIIEAKESFAKDPIRILRAIYLSSKRNIPLNDHMIDAIVNIDSTLFINFVNNNPIKTNCWLKKLLCLGDGVKNFTKLLELKLLPKIFPDIADSLVANSKRILNLLDSADKLTAQADGTDKQPVQVMAADKQPAPVAADKQPAQTLAVDKQPAQTLAAVKQPAQAGAAVKQPAQEGAADKKPALVVTANKPVSPSRFANLNILYAQWIVTLAKSSNLSVFKYTSYLELLAEIENRTELTKKLHEATGNSLPVNALSLINEYAIESLTSEKDPRPNNPLKKCSLINMNFISLLNTSGIHKFRQTFRAAETHVLHAEKEPEPTISTPTQPST